MGNKKRFSAQPVDCRLEPLSGNDLFFSGGTGEAVMGERE